MLSKQTPIANLIFDQKDDILYMELIEGAIADPKSVRQHAEAIQELTAGRKHYVLIDASRNYIRLEHLDDDLLRVTYKNRIASAYYNPTWPSGCVLCK